jgi:cysteinyl-tRNA synthetase
MPLVLYDSYTQKTRPVDETKLITIYDCGPTVYNDVHIGNVRPMITFDVLVKYLRYKQDQVRYVQNLTDIDDKIINKAKQENKTESQISEFYSEQYIKLMAQLNAIKPDVMPKVSENIDDIIDFVDQLVKKNKAYVADDGDVYFSIDSVRDTYGKLSKQNLDELIDGVRKTNKKNKANSLDFVL